MFSKSLLALAVLSNASVLPSPPGITCNIGFYSGTGCDGEPDATCNPDLTDVGFCYWNTWVGSAAYNCYSQASAVFDVCSGSPIDDCTGEKHIYTTIKDTGCVTMNTYDGRVSTYNNNPPGGGNI